MKTGSLAKAYAILEKSWRDGEAIELRRTDVRRFEVGSNLPHTDVFLFNHGWVTTNSHTSGQTTNADAKGDGSVSTRVFSLWVLRLLF